MLQGIITKKNFLKFLQEGTARGSGDHRQKDVCNMFAQAFATATKSQTRCAGAEVVLFSIYFVSFVSLRLDTSQMSLLLKEDLSPSMTTGCSHSQA